MPAPSLSVHPDGYLEHFRARVLEDALNEALPNYWLRRAAAFDAVGTERADAIAAACRNHATFLTMYPVVHFDALRAWLANDGMQERAA